MYPTGKQNSSFEVKLIVNKVKNEKEMKWFINNIKILYKLVLINRKISLFINLIILEGKPFMH
jgi:hypothetical protein